MARYVIDASVIVKWFIEENGSENAESIRVAFVSGDMELVCPHLLQFEVLNALKYSGLFTKAELSTAAESLANYPFSFHALKNDAQAKMIELAMDHDLSIYDASYLALAIVNGTNLVTADEKIEKKLPTSLKNVIKPLTTFEVA
jgi:predicted nucleic acid-binding protein